MAQLKDTLITGGLRVTDTTITDVLQTSAIKAPQTTSTGSFGFGSNGQVLTTDGTHSYWSSDILAASDAMVFKGVLGTGTGMISALPTEGYSAGWTYRVGTAGVYAGDFCEVNDLVIAIKDYVSPGDNTDWTKVEHNIDGAVIVGHTNNTNNSLTANRLVYATGTNQVATAENLHFVNNSLFVQNDLNLYSANNDRYLVFKYTNDTTTTSIAEWRLGYLGSGSDDNNKFVLQSTGSSSSLGSKGEFSDVLSITMNTHHITASNSLTIKGGTVGNTAQSNGLWIYNPGDTSVKYASLYTNSTGTTSAIGVAVLSLGNATVENSDNNARGRAIIYGIKSAATRLESAITGSTSYTMYLPDYAGDGYLVHTSGTSKVGDTTQPVYIAANGRVTAITGAIANNTTGSAAKLSNTSIIGNTNKPVYFTANGVPSAISYTIDANVPSTAVFTDEKVKQTLTSENTEYKILISNNANPTSGETDYTQYSSNVTMNPSTNTITADTYKVTSNATITYNSTNGCLEIIV